MKPSALPPGSREAQSAGDSQRGFRRNRTAPVLALLAAVGLALALYWAQRASDNRELQRELELDGAARRGAIDVQFSEYSATLRMLSAFYDSKETLDSSDTFAMFRAIRKIHTEIRALEWFPRVFREQRAEFERGLRQRGVAGLGIQEKNARGEWVAAETRDEYFPLSLREPADSRSAEGLDANAQADWLSAMNLARDIEAPVASRRQRDDADAGAVLIFSPIYRRDAEHRSIAQRRENLAGFICAVIDPNLSVASSLQRVTPNGLHTALFDLSNPASPELLAYVRTRVDERNADPSPRTPDDWKTGFYYRGELDYLGRAYAVLCRPSDFYLAHQRRRTAEFVLVIGLLAGVLLAVVLSYFLQRREAAKRLADQNDEVAANLAANEARVRFAMDTSQIGYWDLNLANGSAQRSSLHDRIFGYENLQPNWTYERFLEHVIPGDRKAVDDQFRHAVATETDWGFECQIERHGDHALRWIWAAGRHFIDPRDKCKHMTGIVQDITVRKLLESRFRAVIELSPVAMIMIDARGRVVLLNAEAEGMFGYRREEVLGQTVEMLVPQRFRATHPGLREGFFAAPSARRMAPACDVCGLRKNGSEFPIEIALSPVETEEGLFVVGAIIDLSVRRRLEEVQLQFTENLERRVLERTAELEAANKELEAFAYSVSHDLRAPLRAIDGFSRLLEERHATNLDLTAKEYLARVRNATQRMGQLIDDMLMLSRVTRTELRRERVNLSQLARAIVTVLRQRDPQRDVEFVAAPDAVAFCDSHLAQIVLDNLLGNAWKYTSKRARARIEFGVLPEPDTDTFFVCDNGAGFDMAFVDRLFTPFQRLHTADEFPGSGIGLAIVQRIVKRQGGHVWAEAAVESGATLYFQLTANSRRSPKGMHEDFRKTYLAH